MIEALRSAGPDPDHADALMLFGRFVGSWDVAGVLIEPDGSPSEHRGEWHFGWVLEGRAVQDVLISPPRAPGRGASFECGTTIRFYDPHSGVWQVTYVSPVSRQVHRLVGRPSGDEIVQEGARPDGRPQRWTFSDITERSFRWRGEVSADGGRSWAVDEEMRARRR